MFSHFVKVFWISVKCRLWNCHPCLKAFKILLDKALGNLTWTQSWSCFEEEVGLGDLPTSLPNLMIL